MSLVIRKTKGDRIFDYINNLIMFIFIISILLPFLHLLSQSFSGSGFSSKSGMFLIPEKFTLSNYIVISTNKYIWIGYYNTILRTVTGTIASLIMTSTGAYCLSKKYFPNRNFWTFFIVFTMFFSGGMIPGYLLIDKLGLIDSRMALILPGLVGTYNLIIIRNYFQQIPAEIEESGKIDGASSLRIFISLIIPISKPILATVALWVAVGHWNAWFDQLIYIRDTKKFVLQVVLRRIVLEGTQQMMDSQQAQMDYQASPDAIKAACIFFTTLPILCAYPFVQKHFVKGIIIGSLKG